MTPWSLEQESYCLRADSYSQGKVGFCEPNSIDEGIESDPELALNT